MRLPIPKFSSKSGMPPGTLIHIGEKNPEPTAITVFQFNEAGYTEQKISTPEQSSNFTADKGTVWVDVDGLSDTSVIEHMGKTYNLHPLVQEDILHTNQRPKLEDYGDYFYLVVRVLSFDETRREVVSEQISFILKENLLISFQEKGGDIFDPVRNRIRSEKSKIRKMHADYLAYALIDAVVDNYFLILEKMGEQIEALQERLIDDPKPENLTQLHSLKTEMMFLRKSVWPLREVLNELQHTDNPLIHPSTIIYLRDVYDHTVQVMDAIETLRDMLASMFDLYLSSISNKMNQVIKFLTIISTIFMPLTFLVGVYGMNFKYMPELEWRWGYAGVWLLIIIIAATMALYFKARKWL